MKNINFFKYISMFLSWQVQWDVKIMFCTHWVVAVFYLESVFRLGYNIVDFEGLIQLIFNWINSRPYIYIFPYSLIGGLPCCMGEDEFFQGMCCYMVSSMLLWICRYCDMGILKWCCRYVILLHVCWFVVVAKRMVLCGCCYLVITKYMFYSIWLLMRRCSYEVMAKRLWLWRFFDVIMCFC